MKRDVVAQGIIALTLIALSFLTVLADSVPAPSGNVGSDHFLYLPLVIGAVSNPEPGDCYTAEEGQLLTLLNDYRNNNGLPDVATSKSLTAVAQWHVIDLHENNPASGTDPASGLACNLHSWSDQGNWSPVCYTSDHRYASGMWNKPREITNNAYNSNGYENAYGGGGNVTASGAFNAWKNSPGHNAVILEQGIWSNIDWQAMSVGIYKNYAVLWFGELTDPQGPVNQCP